MARLHALEPAALPIPDDVQPGPGWSKVMVEMSGLIGARDVLRLCEQYGGQQVYFPVDPGKAPFADVIGQDKAEALGHLFRMTRLTIPTARYAIARAKRAGVIAAVRVRRLTVAEAAAMLHIRRDTVSQLVKCPTEGIGSAKFNPPPRPKDHRQIEMFPDRVPEPGI